jgi:hypothetical protein
MQLVCRDVIVVVNREAFYHDFKQALLCLPNVMRAHKSMSLVMMVDVSAAPHTCWTSRTHQQSSSSRER